KLAGQAVEKFRTYLIEDDVTNVAQYHKKEIGNYIYSQMMDHFYYETPGFVKTTVRPFTKIEEHNFSKYTKDNIYHYTETVTPTNSIPSKVFSGFKKACHNLYKFDSKTEKDFAIILENDPPVLKWLRPADKQFHIYWNHNSQRYHPDFVVETGNIIYMVETKKEGDIDSSDVQEKARAALQYCTHATDYTTDNGGKPWIYVLIPHNAVMGNMSVDYLVKNFEYKDG
ncbi:MAG: type III restriction endonuclease subunit R, partial [Candidatus Celaenobacter polaris]|nr:type III restriction endonuclease subunit R [Candidatus Celaenobacter polaris]